MIIAGHPYAVLEPAEEDTIHRNLLRIVSEVGLQIEHAGLLQRAEAAGGVIHAREQRVTFAPDVAEAFIASAAQANAPVSGNTHTCTPGVNANASVYHGHYLDPVTDCFTPMTVETARAFFRVARAMPSVTSLSILGCPWVGADTAPELEPLYERLWAWRLDIHPDGSIHRKALCPYILEMCQAHAQLSGQSLNDVFSATVYLLPALKLGYVEAEQVAHFLEHGMRTGIGSSMITGGATGPVTLAGMVTLALAESLLVALLNRALWGTANWHIAMSVTAMDMRTAMRPYGRPDMPMATLMAAQMARRYGVPCTGHCGLSDAMRPSPQAAAQKLMSALPTLWATGHATIQAGLLGVDEIYSPLQLVLDDQLTDALSAFTHDYAVSDESIAADLVAMLGPGGNYMAEEHTVQWLRREMWEPRLWERRPFPAWLRADKLTDVDRARQQVQDILSHEAPADILDRAEEQILDGIIAQAKRDRKVFA